MTKIIAFLLFLLVGSGASAMRLQTPKELQSIPEHDILRDKVVYASAAASSTFAAFVIPILKKNRVQQFGLLKRSKSVDNFAQVFHAVSVPLRDDSSDIE